MKSRFAITTLVLAATCSTAIAAEALGVLPPAISNVLTFPTVVGWSVAAGVLGFAWRDYGHPPGQKKSSKTRRAAPAGSRASAGEPAHDWVYRTISA